MRRGLRLYDGDQMSDQPSISPGPRDRELFLAALELPADERDGFLIAQCGTDNARRERVLALLREHQADSSFLDQAAVARDDNAGHGTGGTLLSTSNAGRVSAAIGERIGRYKLLQQIGEGGCGIVYMAEQEEPVRRKVALKIIKLGMDTRHGRRPLRAAAAGARAPLKLVWIRSNLFELVDAVELLWETRP